MDKRRRGYQPEDDRLLYRVITATEFVINEFERTGVFPKAAEAAAHVLEEVYDPRSAKQHRAGRSIARVLGSIVDTELLHGDNHAALSKLHAFAENHLHSE